MEQQEQQREEIRLRRGVTDWRGEETKQGRENATSYDVINDGRRE